MKSVRVRFAPSPTGMLHLGGARTALFNWLFAHTQEGSFLLRIEDTDRERSKQAFSEAILDDLTWLGLAHDEDIVWQSNNQDRHRELAHQLLRNGRAYRCYASPQELADMREEARQKGWSRHYNGYWRDRPQHEAPAGVNPVIRLKVPRSDDSKERIMFKDLVQGEISQPLQQVDDFVLLRSDGSPTYMLSVVIDDHDAGVTHVIRGADHTTNSFRQIQLYRSLEWEVPQFAHLPLIHDKHGKMSKRLKLSEGEDNLNINGDVASFRKAGYLPEALRNALLRLGWSHKDYEKIDDRQAISLFKISDVGRSAAQFDLAKLNDLNHHYMQQTSEERLWHLWQDFLPRADTDGSKEVHNRLRCALPVLVARHKTLKEAGEAADFLIKESVFPLDGKAKRIFEQHDKMAALSLLNFWLDLFHTHENPLESFRAIAKQKALNFATYASLLRVVLTGSMRSPDLHDVIDLLGKRVCISRLELAIAQVNTTHSPEL